MVAHYCKDCSFCCSSWKDMMKHMFQCHSKEPNFSYQCGISGCIQTFKTYSAIASHLQRKHPNCDLELSQRDIFQDSDGTMDYENEESDECSRQSSSDTEKKLQAQKSIALLLLTLKERYKVTQAAVDFTLTQVKQTVALLMEDVKGKVMDILKDGSTRHDDITSCFDDLDIFDGLSTEYKQSQFYQKQFNLVEPVTVELETELVPSQCGTKNQLIEKKYTFQYVPLLDGLQALLSKQEILDEVLLGHDRHDDYIADFCDARLFKEHDYFKSHSNSLQLVAYFDEVEVCNPLAGHAGKHKLGLFYYLLGNLRPELRSTHRCIQLIACVECPVLNRYGFEKVLAPFIRDVNILSSDGITVNVSGCSQQFYGTVLLVLADTLAAHQLGGFKVGVGFSLRVCRDCMATKEMIQDKFTEDEFTLRDPVTHAHHCALLNGPLRAEDSTTYGINGVSVLSSIDHFQIGNFQMPQDVMHVVLEGVLANETKVMLGSFIQEEKLFSLDLLNERVLNFTYGRVESRNKPPRPFQISNFSSSTQKLRLSAAQLWTFTVLLPLMIGDKVPFDNRKWECFLLLLEITKVCTARITSSEASAFLNVLVEEHHRLFKLCYPGVSLTPKFHYMVHFPRLLTHIGPMVNSWCMRMEAKNSYFKRVAQIGNFKNLPYSVARRHQRLLCGFLQGKFFDYEDLEFGPCKDGAINKLSGDDLHMDILQHLPETDPDTLISRPNWISAYGERYYQKEYIHIGFQDDDLPQFGKILDMIVVRNITLFQLEVYQTFGINSHLSAYAICRQADKKLMILQHLQNKQRYYSHPYRGDSNIYIVMKSNYPNCF